MLEILLCPKSLATALALVCFSTQMSRVWTSRGFHGWDSPEVRSELELIERMRAQAFSIAMDGNSSAIWYFAYGANMASSVLARRSLAPLEVCSNVTVPDCKLSFDLLGVPYNEPALASLTAKTSTREFAVCGVAYLLSTADLSRLVTSEGGAVAYMVTKVVGVLPNRGPLNMITLVAKKPAARSRVPSKRYLVSFFQPSDSIEHDTGIRDCLSPAQENEIFQVHIRSTLQDILCLIHSQQQDTESERNYLTLYGYGCSMPSRKAFIDIEIMRVMLPRGF
ncbi:hypothetical protein EV356DRAFT_120998 [Viridothelium virens]|uniref:Gamma-glutamylcyclotransferase n=1 Tax=Viridothelium virens TaxID=1048519 RepID=A0A6A6HBL3_VIRVR|nr:hypothetical protein EV356DRAFT_120998 [Viridothelium virens]